MGAALLAVQGQDDQVERPAAQPELVPSDHAADLLAVGAGVQKSLTSLWGVVLWRKIAQPPHRLQPAPHPARRARTPARPHGVRPAPPSHRQQRPRCSLKPVVARRKIAVPACRFPTSRAAPPQAVARPAWSGGGRVGAPDGHVPIRPADHAVPRRHQPTGEPARRPAAAGGGASRVFFLVRRGDRTGSSIVQPPARSPRGRGRPGTPPWRERQPAAHAAARPAPASPAADLIPGQRLGRHSLKPSRGVRPWQLNSASSCRRVTRSGVMTLPP